MAVNVGRKYFSLRRGYGQAAGGYREGLAVATRPYGEGHAIELAGLRREGRHEDVVVGGVLGAVKIYGTSAVVGRVAEFRCVVPAAPVILGVPVLVGVDHGALFVVVGGIEAEGHGELRALAVDAVAGRGGEALAGAAVAPYGVVHAAALEGAVVGEGGAAEVLGHNHAGRLAHHGVGELRGVDIAAVAAFGGCRPAYHGPALRVGSQAEVAGSRRSVDAHIPGMARARAFAGAGAEYHGEVVDAFGEGDVELGTLACGELFGDERLAVDFNIGEHLACEHGAAVGHGGYGEGNLARERASGKGGGKLGGGCRSPGLDYGFGDIEAGEFLVVGEGAYGAGLAGGGVNLIEAGAAGKLGGGPIELVGHGVEGCRLHELGLKAGLSYLGALAGGLVDAVERRRRTLAYAVELAGLGAGYGDELGGAGYGGYEAGVAVHGRQCGAEARYEAFGVGLLDIGYGVDVARGGVVAQVVGYLCLVESILHERLCLAGNFAGFEVEDAESGEGVAHLLGVYIGVVVILPVDECAAAVGEIGALGHHGGNARIGVGLEGVYTVFGAGGPAVGIDYGTVDCGAVAEDAHGGGSRVAGHGGGVVECSGHIGPLGHRRHYVAVSDRRSRRLLYGHGACVGAGVARGALLGSGRGRQ